MKPQEEPKTALPPKKLTVTKAVDPSAASELPPDADPEEQFNDFWKKNGSAIFTGIAVAAVLTFGVQMYRYFAARHEKGIRTEYGMATEKSTLPEFIAEHPRHSLAGLAHAQLAKEAYAAGRYEEAKAHFEASLPLFEELPLAERSRLGLAMCQLKLGQSAEARQALQALSTDGQALQITRAEAAYNLAILNWEQGDFAAAQTALASIDTLPEAGFWAFRATQLRERVAELRPTPAAP